jgi:hypothetical protein
MKNTLHMDSVAMIYMLIFIKTGSGIQKFDWGGGGDGYTQSLVIP